MGKINDEVDLAKHISESNKCFEELMGRVADLGTRDIMRSMAKVTGEYLAQLDEMLCDSLDERVKSEMLKGYRVSSWFKGEPIHYLVVEGNIVSDIIRERTKINPTSPFKPRLEMTLVAHDRSEASQLGIDLERLCEQLEDGR